jgi:hypothetical protein
MSCMSHATFRDPPRVNKHLQIIAFPWICHGSDRYNYAVILVPQLAPHMHIRIAEYSVKN